MSIFDKTFEDVQKMGTIELHEHIAALFPLGIYREIEQIFADPMLLSKIDLHYKNESFLKGAVFIYDEEPRLLNLLFEKKVEIKAQFLEWLNKKIQDTDNKNLKDKYLLGKQPIESYLLEQKLKSELLKKLPKIKLKI